MYFRLCQGAYDLLKTVDFSEIEGEVRIYDASRTVWVESNAIRRFQRIILQETIKQYEEGELTQRGEMLDALYNIIVHQKRIQLRELEQ